MFRRLSVLLALLVFSAAVHADTGRGGVRKQVESSLSVTGTVDITPAGDVVAHTLDQPEKLPKGIVDMVARIAPRWKFESIPLQGNAVSRSAMSLLFVAKKHDDGQLTVELRSASFNGPSPQGRTTLDKKTFRTPDYPFAALGGSGVSGTVYLVVRYDREGRILDIDAEQVNMRVIGTEAQMAQWRRALTQSCLTAAKRWKLVVPDGGIPKDRDFTVGRIPVSFSMESMRETRYGQWEAYIPGPRASIPWMANTSLAGSAPDAFAPGAFHSADAQRHLLTSLSDG